MGCVHTKKKKSVDHDYHQDTRRTTPSILPVFKIDGPASPDRISDPEPPSGPPSGNPSSSWSATIQPTKQDTKDAKVTGKYRLKTLIGEGTFSRVWMVESRLTRQPYAMKMTKGPEGRYIYESELAILSRVRHPNVVQLIETFETDGERFYMVMELATGGDLFDRVLQQPSGRFGEPTAARVLRQVLDGVAYLHGLGITHRDLKPDNLLFYHPGEDSRILISDFSVAHRRGSDGNRFMRTGCGTAEYLAPEVLGRQAYTSAVDLWAVGVVAYVVLSGAFPFDQEEGESGVARVHGLAPIKLYHLIMKGVYSFDAEAWQDVSSPAKDFIRHLLVVDPKLRFTAPQALRHPWFKRRRDLACSPGGDDEQQQQLGRCLSTSSRSTNSSNESFSSQPPHHDLQDLQQLRQSVLGHLNATDVH